jgi:hypothetical protein
MTSWQARYRDKLVPIHDALQVILSRLGQALAIPSRFTSHWRGRVRVISFSSARGGSVLFDSG